MSVKNATPFPTRADWAKFALRCGALLCAYGFLVGVVVSEVKAFLALYHGRPEQAALHAFAGVGCFFFFRGYWAHYRRLGGTPW